MCVTSMVGDHYREKFTPWPYPDYPPAVPMHIGPTRTEFDALKRDVLEMKELLKRAKKYDEDNGEPECEMDEKMDLLRKVAKMVGVDLDDVIGPSR